MINLASDSSSYLPEEVVVVARHEVFVLYCLYMTQMRMMMAVVVVAASPFFSMAQMIQKLILQRMLVAVVVVATIAFWCLYAVWVASLLR